ncbi:hypothetical protein [Natrinema sp. DC36]|uniref:hypothetical protein n=1 Tax=Natrinema sp. DC36 TaxID=2878680 RepID=UPI001CF0CF7D|nr:hypothetical protein [Natrinema sp. DC36]
MKRRTFVSAISVSALPLSGCLQNENQPVGTIVVSNDHSFPHIVTLEITMYTSGQELEHETVSRISIDPESERVYEGAFNPQTGYLVTVELPGSETAEVPYGREGISIEENNFFIRIGEDGHLNAGVSSR